MFTDKRSRTVVFISHCLINQNAISDGTATHRGMVPELVELLCRAGIGMVQMPCPEMMCLGLNRGNNKGSEYPVTVENTRIRRALEEPGNMEKVEALAAQVVFQMTEYLKHGFEVAAIIGINRSPSCGIDTTSNDGREVQGRGLYMEILDMKMAKQNIRIKKIGIKTNEAKALQRIVNQVIQSKKKQID